MGRENYGFIFAVEDQRDWKSIRGCFSNPFSCFFCHVLRVLGARKVLDLNYGKGSFYEKCSDIEIVGVDIVKWDWLVQPTRFIQGDMVDVLNTISDKFDVVVLDPPYNTKPSSRTIESNREYLYFGNVPFPKVVKAIRIIKEKGIARYIILKYMPADYSEEIELLKITKYRVIWRFFHSMMVYNSGNKVVRNYTELFII